MGLAEGPERGDHLIGIWSLLYLFDLKLIELLKMSPATNRLHGVWRGKLYIWCLPLWNQVATRAFLQNVMSFLLIFGQGA